jgi:hypothetical protein
MRRRRFCLGLGIITGGVLLAGCERGGIAPAAVQFHPAETGQRLAGLSVVGLSKLLVASHPQGEDLASGLFVYSGARRRNLTGALEVSYFLSPGNLRLDYRIFASGDAAQADYDRTVAGLQVDPRSNLTSFSALPYPSTALVYDDTGRTAVLVGQVVVAVIASGSNPHAITALTLGGVAHLEQAVATSEQ